jgi:hypothetical protein
MRAHLLLGHGKLDRLHMHLRALFHENFEINPDSVEADWEAFVTPPFEDHLQDRRKIVLVIDVMGDRR